MHSTTLNNQLQSTPAEAFRISCHVLRSCQFLTWHIAKVGYSSHPIAHLDAERSQLIVCLHHFGRDKYEQLGTHSAVYSCC